MNLQYRTATMADYPKIMASCSRERRQSPAGLRKALNSAAVIVAYDNDRFVGFARAAGNIDPFQCELVIERPYRNKGVGLHMVSYLQRLVTTGLYHVS